MIDLVSQMVEALEKVKDTGNTMVSQRVSFSDNRYVVAVMTEEQYKIITEKMVIDPRSSRQ